MARTHARLSTGPPRLQPKSHLALAHGAWRMAHLSHVRHRTTPSLGERPPEARRPLAARSAAAASSTAGGAAPLAGSRGEGLTELRGDRQDCEERF